MSPGMKPNLATTMLQTIAGERPAPSKTQMAKLVAKGKLRRIGQAVIRMLPAWHGRSAHAFAAEDTHGRSAMPRPYPAPTSSRTCFSTSAKKRLGDHPALRQALEAGSRRSASTRRCSASFPASTATSREGLASAISESIDDASFTGLFDSIAAILGQQFVLLALLLRGVPPEQGAAPPARDHRQPPAAGRRTFASGCSPTRSMR